MSNPSRRPLTARTSQSLLFPSPVRSLKSGQQPKRARSPDSAAHSIGSFVKRHKSATLNTNPPHKAVKKERDPEAIKKKEEEKASREQQRAEFREKYRRAFPGWTFYFDTLSINDKRRESFQSRIEGLGGKVELFFDCQRITHVVSDRPIPSQVDIADKENINDSRGTAPPSQLVESPVKTLTRPQDGQQTKDVIKAAATFGLKIWDTTKLESVLSRCADESATVAPATYDATRPRNQHNLSKLLQSERIHGLSERDPTQKRHDFRYFTRGSYFVLVEDIRNEVATIAAHEYPAYKERDGEKTPWPTLYCHPQARGPFVPFDEKEKKRWQRLQEAEKKENAERKARCETFLRRQLIEKKTDPRLIARKSGDLRRSVSMISMRNAMNGDVFIDQDVEGDAADSVNASGYLASGLMGYMAASGNSVGITSTTGTTSTANYTSRNLQIPSNLTGRMRQEIVMRRVPQEKVVQAVAMAPPAQVPQRHSVLKKSKSTNTLKLPKREEGSKPGYCESCRAKFEDFQEHIHGRRHRKFAENDNNFLGLDFLLNRVQRRTLAERQALDTRRIDICRMREQESGNDADLIVVDA
ncbi:hypothetical protein NP233_g8367 [Leucocoprinus birnbaumii]|uniref:DBF4-type domain-containing protein n=1 Tax=Leucocoprinus birnbaumii TaxID=56174 RepID=A0AAD5YTU0_9AGAR|nr:hypothetical protein NP233_g8367 [Leucocoprinus birnbaumii]